MKSPNKLCAIKTVFKYQITHDKENLAHQNKILCCETANDVENADYICKNPTKLVLPTKY